MFSSCKLCVFVCLLSLYITSIKKNSNTRRQKDAFLFDDQIITYPECT